MAMREVMTELTSKWQKRGHELDFSVGIALGYATRADRVRRAVRLRGGGQRDEPRLATLR